MLTKYHLLRHQLSGHVKCRHLISTANHHRHNPDIKLLCCFYLLCFSIRIGKVAIGLEMHICLECHPWKLSKEFETLPNRERLRKRQAATFVLRLSTFLVKFFRSLPILSLEIKIPKTFTGSLVQARPV